MDPGHINWGGSLYVFILFAIGIQVLKTDDSDKQDRLVCKRLSASDREFNYE